MRSLKKLWAVLGIFALLLLAGCARSDVTLTVNDDGSFRANISYSIVKSLMGSPEVEAQVKSLITDSLDQSGIEYTESENDEYVTISVERSFADLAELTSEAAWQGISMVPKLSAEQTEGSLWVRYEDGRLKIDGTLDADAFGAAELVSSETGNAESFGGSLTVALPAEAESAAGAEAAGEYTYRWSGTGADSVAVSLVSGGLEAAETVAEQQEAAASEEAETAEETAEEEPSTAVQIAVIAAVIVVAGAVAIVLAVKNKKNSHEE